MAKVPLKLYETQGSVELAMSNYVPIKLYEDDGTTRAQELVLPSTDAAKLDVSDPDVEDLINKNDPRIIARSYIAHRRVLEKAKSVVNDTFNALELSQRLAKVGKSQHDTNSTLCWDALQLLGHTICIIIHLMFRIGSSH